MYKPTIEEKKRVVAYRVLREGKWISTSQRLQVAEDKKDKMFADNVYRHKKTDNISVSQLE